MTTAPLEELLRETLDRLQRQEERTAALEAALHAAPERAAHPLTQTPSLRSDETHHGPAPKREPAAEPSAPVSPATVIESLDDVVWSVSPDGQFVFFIGGAVERLYGLSAPELHDHRGRWLDAVPPEDRERFRAALARLPDAGSFTLEHRVAHACGGFRWASTRGKLVRDRDGRPLRVDGVTTDVTRRARTRDAILDILTAIGPASGSNFLAKLTLHLCAACEARAAIVAEPDATDPGAARAVAAHVGGRSAEAFTFPAGGALVRELLSGGHAFAPTAATRRYQNDPLLLQLRAETFAAEPLTDESGRRLGFLAIADDRSFGEEIDLRAILKALAPRAAVELAWIQAAAGRRELAARLESAERRARDAEELVRDSAHLAATGRMAAGLAHDFNNLLGVMAGNADLIRESLPDGDPRRETADVIARTAQTVAGMNRKLLASGKPCPSRVAPLDAAGAIRALEPLLRRLAGRKVALGLDLAPELPLVCADATQFDRVILNLVLNARDAVEATGGANGSVTVRAAAADIEAGRAGWPAERPPGQYVAITVADSGCGMPAEVRAKMFDRYFTTKGERGSGLGLATVMEAVTAARGHVEVESEPGWGTQVRVYWPALQA